MRIPDELRSLRPYQPGKPISETQREYGLSQVIKLASNENPLGISPLAQQALRSAIKEQFRYPDPSCFELHQKVCNLWGQAHSRVSFGNGSDEIIDLLIRIFCDPHDSILISEYSFQAYEVSAGSSRVNVIKVPTAPGFKIDLKRLTETYFKQRDSHKIRMIFIPNPNNPTGSYLPEADVKQFVQDVRNEKDLVVVFDEAYHEFIRAQDYESMLNAVDNQGNFCVIRTFSKSLGLAGLRLGALIGPTELVEIYNRIRKPFNVNTMAQVAAIAALDDKEFIRKTQEVTWEGLSYWYKELERLGLPYYPSQGNFILVDTLRRAEDVYQNMLRKGVILRPLRNYGFVNHLRISIGLPAENQIGVKALEECLAEIPPLPPEQRCP
ncbi:MAG: histidinol-phosphate transaminase [Bdellovibrionota bacterium]